MNTPKYRWSPSGRRFKHKRESSESAMYETSDSEEEKSNAIKKESNVKVIKKP